MFNTYHSYVVLFLFCPCVFLFCGTARPYLDQAQVSRSSGKGQSHGQENVSFAARTLIEIYFYSLERTFVLNSCFAI